MANTPLDPDSLSAFQTALSPKDPANPTPPGMESIAHAVVDRARKIHNVNGDSALDQQIATAQYNTFKTDLDHLLAGTAVGPDGAALAPLSSDQWIALTAAQSYLHARGDDPNANVFSGFNAEDRITAARNAWATSHDNRPILDAAGKPTQGTVTGNIQQTLGLSGYSNGLDTGGFSLKGMSDQEIRRFDVNLAEQFRKNPVNASGTSTSERASTYAMNIYSAARDAHLSPAAQTALTNALHSIGTQAVNPSNPLAIMMAVGSSAAADNLKTKNMEYISVDTVKPNLSGSAPRSFTPVAPAAAAGGPPPVNGAPANGAPAVTASSVPQGFYAGQADAKAPDLTGAAHNGEALFAHGSHTLDHAAEAELRKFVDGQIAAHRGNLAGMKLSVDGYADGTGADPANGRIAQQRADAIRSIVLNEAHRQGVHIDEKAVTATGHGSQGSSGNAADQSRRYAAITIKP
ncbi:MAG TPA: OmpA family protein [Alphaproteobacteria bacterium]|nr:OmpA family protein [Alphaproteobacteria bacterium]